MSSNDPGADWDAIWSSQPPPHSADTRDPDALAEAVLSVCGDGTVLDVGCGDGRLVQALLRRGVDARGVDRSPVAVELAARRAPRRFATARAEALPHEGHSVENVVMCALLDYLPDQIVAAALREAARVARGALVVLVRSAQPPDDPHVVARSRQWWFEQVLELGFRRHPRAAVADQYRDECLAPGTHLLAFERLPAENPADAGDFLRQASPVAFQCAARYRSAARFLRQGDAVAVIAEDSESVAGARIVAAAAPVARVTAVLTTEPCTSVATDEPRMHVIRDATPQLVTLADASFDALIVLSAGAGAAATDWLAVGQRVLRPAGRLVLYAGVRGDAAADRSDPWTPALRGKLREATEGRRPAFLLEHTLVCRSEPADGDAALVEPDWSPAAPSATSASDALLVLMKSPLGASRNSYVENNFPAYSSPAAHITAFARDYDNPWLVRAMVSIGLRSTNPAVLERLATGTLESARHGSADFGAALCVVAYRLLESPPTDAGSICDLLAQVDRFDRAADASPHAQRWRISNLYVAGRLLLETGDRPAARDMFLRCAALDPLAFSPLLATKTVDALLRAGGLHWCDGQADAARECWRRGLSETQRVLQADWSNVWGELDDPVTFGLPEVAQLAHGAARCADALWAAARFADVPGLMWSLLADRAAARDAGDSRRWHRVLQRREAALVELTAYNADLRAGRDWWENQARSARHGCAQRDRMLAELRSWAADLQARLERQGAGSPEESPQASHPTA